MSNGLVETFTFHSGSTITSIGNIFGVKLNSSLMNIEVSGTSTDFVLNFEGLVTDGGDWKAVKCSNLATWAGAITTSTKDYIWQFSLEGFVSVRVKLQSIANGNVTVIGRIVN
jgi:hypothetical protein